MKEESMKKRNSRRLSLNSETLRQLDKLDTFGAIVGGNATAASVCRMASDCVDCDTTTGSREFGCFTTRTG
jgi:hypothetical protein